MINNSAELGQQDIRIAEWPRAIVVGPEDVPEQAGFRIQVRIHATDNLTLALRLGERVKDLSARVGCNRYMCQQIQRLLIEARSRNLVSWEGLTCAWIDERARHPA